MTAICTLSSLASSGELLELGEHALADLDRLAEVAGLAVAAAQRDGGLDPEHAALAGAHERLELEDRVVDVALTLQRAGDDEATAEDELVLRRDRGTVDRVARLALRLDVLAGLERELGEVHGQLDLVVLTRGHAAKQMLGGYAESRGEVVERLAVRPALAGLDARDVADGDVITGELGLGPPLRDPGSADPLPQLSGVELLEQVGIPDVHGGIVADVRAALGMKCDNSSIFGGKFRPN